jgi:hypothetical protein
LWPVIAIAEPLSPGWHPPAAQAEGGPGDLFDAQGAIAGCREQIRDPAFDVSRAFAHGKDDTT